MAKKISAVICTYKRYDLLDRAIESCIAQTLPKKLYEILVIDNTPPCAERAAFAEKYRDHKYVTYLTEDTPGLSNARNVAAEKADSPFVAYLDDDAIADAGWLKAIVDAFEAFGSDAAIVGGRIDPIWDVPRPSWLPDELLGMLTIVNWGGPTRVARPSEWVAGANIAFRVSALQEVGGFNVSLGRTGAGGALLSNEESAVVEGLKAKGYNLIYAPEARVDHLVDRRRLEQSWIRRRQAWQAVSDFIKTPDEFEGKEQPYWNVVARFMSKCPPRYRNPAGLFMDIEDPDTFNDQVRATYCMVSLMLMGGQNPDKFTQEI
jgi:glycosyltransferase involved in cell wall biosynthesis